MPFSIHPPHDKKPVHSRTTPADAPGALQRGGAAIREGRLVAFPTETVYGLGADALNPEAVARIFAAKRRPRFDPLIVHVSNLSMLEQLVTTVSSGDRKLIDAFWPGPLTLIFPKRHIVPDLVTAGLPTVAIRCPFHPVALSLIQEAGTPIAAPSANTFGYVSPTTAHHVAEGLGHEVDLVLDAGPSSIGVESTIVSLIGPRPALLRPGGVPIDRVEAVLGMRIDTPPAHSPLLSPGRLARHYAPRTSVTLLSSPSECPPISASERVGLLTVTPPPNPAPRLTAIEILSASGDLREAAQRLFAALRRLDTLGLDRLYIAPCEEQGLGAAIMDRLRRCAAPLDLAPDHQRLGCMSTSESTLPPLLE